MSTRHCRRPWSRCALERAFSGRAWRELDELAVAARLLAPEAELQFERPVPAAQLEPLDLRSVLPRGPAVEPRVGDVLQVIHNGYADDVLVRQVLARYVVVQAVRRFWSVDGVERGRYLLVLRSQLRRSETQ